VEQGRLSVLRAGGLEAECRLLGEERGPALVDQGVDAGEGLARRVGIAGVEGRDRRVDIRRPVRVVAAQALEIGLGAGDLFLEGAGLFRGDVALRFGDQQDEADVDLRRLGDGDRLGVGLVEQGRRGAGLGKPAA
jgi:hypothetical protein